MRWTTAFGRRLRGFSRDQRGTASMEFVVTLPLLLGPLVLFAEYGEALSERERLDSALAEATQLLSVSPAWPGRTEANNPWLYTPFVMEAWDIVAERLGVERDDIAFTAALSNDLSNGELRVPFYMVSTSASLTIDTGLLAVINAFAATDVVTTTLQLNAWDQMRYVAAVPPIDNSPCFWDPDADNGHGNNREAIGKDGKSDDCDNVPGLDTDPADGDSGHQSSPGAADVKKFLWGYTPGAQRGNNG